ncbi:hypothetical protein AZA_20712 [Nitrospirillum viridazoti Y2]|nr:hypothetical protein AZA_20712 [Nitrospirillum amazonense Y2]
MISRSVGALVWAALRGHSGRGFSKTRGQDAAPPAVPERHPAIFQGGLETQKRGGAPGAPAPPGAPPGK